MSFTTLRVLTLKSTLKFGIHSDMKVSQMLQAHKGSYLVWAYYSLAAISFDDEVLNMLGITNKIQKPGKDVGYYECNSKELNTQLMAPKLSTKEFGYNHTFMKKLGNDGIKNRETLFNSKRRNQIWNQHGLSAHSLKSNRHI